MNKMIIKKYKVGNFHPIYTFSSHFLQDNGKWLGIQKGHIICKNYFAIEFNHKDFLNHKRILILAYIVMIAIIIYTKKVIIIEIKTIGNFMT